MVFGDKKEMFRLGQAAERGSFSLVGIMATTLPGIQGLERSLKEINEILHISHLLLRVKNKEDLDVDPAARPARADTMELMVPVKRGAQFAEDNKLELLVKSLVEQVRVGGGDLPVSRQQ